MKRDREKDKRVPYFRILNWYFFCICIYFIYGKILQQHIHVVHLENPIVGLLTNHHSFKSFVCWTLGFCTFILSLEKGTYKYQFTQFGWTHVTLLMVVVSASCMINNMYDGMVSMYTYTCLCMCMHVYIFFFLCGVRVCTYTTCCTCFLKYLISACQQHVYMCVYIHTHTHTFHIYACMYTRTPAHTHMYIQCVPHTRTFACICMDVCAHTCMYVCVCTLTHSLTHTCTRSSQVWFFVPVCLVIWNDVYAYVFGRFWGRTPLIKLSPKKTWYVQMYVVCMHTYICMLLCAKAYYVHTYMHICTFFDVPF